MTTTIKGICPSCYLPYRRRNKGGLCPNCGEVIYLINGFASTEERPALSVELLEHFCKLVTAKSHVVLVFPEFSSQWKLQLAHAITFLGRCDGDIDLAKETLTQLFTLKAAQSWKDRTSLFHCLGSDFYLALRAAKKVMGQRRAEEAALSRSMSRSAVEVPIPTF